MERQQERQEAAAPELAMCERTAQGYLSRAILGRVLANASVCQILSAEEGSATSSFSQVSFDPRNSHTVGGCVFEACDQGAYSCSPETVSFCPISHPDSVPQKRYLLGTGEMGTAKGQTLQADRIARAKALGQKCLVQSRP